MQALGTGGVPNACPHCGEAHAKSVKQCPATGRAMPGAFLPGTVLDAKYRIVGHLADGGMGAVYEAEHLSLGKRLAIKVLHPEFSKNEDMVARFHKEARAASSIGHENIIDISDMGRTPDNSLFIVMELLRGQNLADRLAACGGRMPHARAAHVIRQVLAALGAAHKNAIVHRDLKPENVFLVARGQDPDFVKVLDFGISKILSDAPEAALSSTGFVLGTPYYMAPEQARGGRLDHRVDIYACGAILYQLVTGQLPFMAPNFNALMFEIAAGRYTPPRALVPDIPPAFEQIIQWAMARDPDARYRTVDHFLQWIVPFAQPALAPITFAEPNAATLPLDAPLDQVVNILEAPTDMPTNVHGAGDLDESAPLDFSTRNQTQNLRKSGTEAFAPTIAAAPAMAPAARPSRATGGAPALAAPVGKKKAPRSKPMAAALHPASGIATEAARQATAPAANRSKALPITIVLGVLVGLGAGYLVIRLLDRDKGGEPTVAVVKAPGGVPGPGADAAPGGKAPALQPPGADATPAKPTPTTPTPPPTPPPAAPPDAAPAKAPPPAAPPDAAPAKAPPAAPPVPARKATITFLIDPGAAEATAVVTVNGKLIDGTLLRADVGTRVVLRVTARGYARYVNEFDVTGDANIKVSLKRFARAPIRPPPKKLPPKKPPPKKPGGRRPPGGAINL